MTQITSTTTCLFHSQGSHGEHIGCVEAMRFGGLWLVNDGQTRYWTTQQAIDLASDGKYADEDEGYSLWCSDTVARGYGDSYGIPDSLPADLSAAAIALESRIEAEGGMEYALLLSE